MKFMYKLDCIIASVRGFLCLLLIEVVHKLARKVNLFLLLDGKVDRCLCFKGHCRPVL